MLQNFKSWALEGLLVLAAIGFLLLITMPADAAKILSQFCINYELDTLNPEGIMPEQRFSGQVQELLEPYVMDFANDLIKAIDPLVPELTYAVQRVTIKAPMHEGDCELELGILMFYHGEPDKETQERPLLDSKPAILHIDIPMPEAAKIKTEVETDVSSH